MKLAAPIAAALLGSVSSLSFAATTTPDYTDLWYNASESGWGANVVQQGNTLFITMFVYGSQGQPTWFVASSVVQAGGSSSTTFTGTLYQTTGPYFASSTFNPSSVGVTPVGTVTFAASGSNAATLSYSVNGTPVSKNVVRQTWASDNLAGTYIGGSMGTWSSCPARNGYVEASANYTVSHDGSSVQIREEGQGFTCTYTGTYTPRGRFGIIAGGGICTDGVNQAFTATDVLVTRDSISMRLDLSQIGGCRFAGRLGGMRRGAL